MNRPGGEDRPDTRGRAYTERLLSKGNVGWRARLDVQRPYRWNLNRLNPGRCLDVGCGVGRYLAALPAGSVGVDHNVTSVAVCRAQGLSAYTPEEFLSLDGVGEFDTTLVAHVLEHVDGATGVDLLTTYGAFLKPDGRAIVITPQERGFASDSTHVRWMGFGEVAAACDRSGLTVTRQYSFPFPRAVGRVFYANEFVTVASRRAAAEGQPG